jgi:hypothetical protein
MPVQMLLLHFRRYQVLLVFWYILFATLAGNFMENFGANSLYLAPEYLGTVNFLSSMIVGVSIGVFIMSWNITTFILNRKYIRFLATTAQPFLKYCINNGIIPLIFLIFYFFRAIHYDLTLELFSVTTMIILIGGFLFGLIISVFASAFYFFSADKRIYRSIGKVIDLANKKYEQSARRKKKRSFSNDDIRIDWFLSALFGLRKPRDVRHYSQEFLDSIFKRHHLAAIIAIFAAFIFLTGVGYFSDNKIFQVPAAASITVFFAILIAVSGAVSLFLRSWSIPAMLALYIIVNFLFRENIIDPRNKAYGLNYLNENERPVYNKDNIEKMTQPVFTESDKQSFLQTLNKWKAKQGTDKPIMFIISVSGGGTRSAAFAMNVLQQLDNITNKQLMQHSVLITGASGGMMGAAYYRALYWEKQKGRSIDPDDKKYVDDVSKDLLNPLFSSFISRDLIGPAKKFEFNGFTYVKDRAYAFEQKLNENTGGLLDKKISDYKDAETNADIPIIFFNAAITRDARKMIIGSRPARFLMRDEFDTARITPNDADAIDFASFFQKQNATDLSVLSAIRMNATFPFALPNVWLPSDPVIDVMDAGMRDDFGQEEALRFTEVFKDWIKENTGKVVLIQIRDRQLANWDIPAGADNLLSFLTKPFLMLENNMFKLQDYAQTDALDYMSDYFGNQLDRVLFQYVPENVNASASLSFHLTASEKVDIAAALNNANNKMAFAKVKEIMK